MKLSRLDAGDSDDALAFWRHAEGMGSGGVQTVESLTSFLKRNPGLSFKITDRERIVGTVLCGHDGRRGYLHHLAIAHGYADQNIGKTLIDRSLAGLEQLGIDRCHVFIAADNENSREFLTSIDWNEQGELSIFSHDLEYPTA